MSNCDRCQRVALGDCHQCIEMGLHSLRSNPRPLLIGNPNSPILKLSTGQEVVYGAAGDFGPLTLLASWGSAGNSNLEGVMFNSWT